MASIQSSTFTTYSSTIKRWWFFCQKNSVNIFNPQIPQIISFFTQDFQSGFSFSSLNCACAAIALIVRPRLTDDPRLKRFFQGLANLRAAQPKYATTWNPQSVLDFFRNQPASELLDLPTLSKKLITLLALLTGHRMQTFATISLANIRVSSEATRIFIPTRIKTTRTGCPQPVLVLPVYTDQKVCAAHTLNCYIQKTASLRGRNQLLFIALSQPHKPVGTQTLSRWVKDMLKACGVDTSFSSHSSRHAATSAAKRGGVSLASIRATAGWTAGSQTFARFYDRPIIEPDTTFALAVLKP